MKNSNSGLLSIAQTLLDDQHTQQACQLLDEVINIDPENRMAHILFGHALCRLGRYDLGCKEFTWIWKPVFGNQIGLLSSSQDLIAKTILISSDAGLGDSIMFSRLLTKWSHPQTKVILQVQPQLVRLFKQSNLCDEVVSSDQINLPEHDIRVPMHSLMAAMDIGDKWPLNEAPSYLISTSEDVEKFRKLIPNDGRRKVGLCWRGNPTLPIDSKRSISFEQIKNFTLPDDQLFSLVPNFSSPNFQLKSFELQDIAQTAALIQCLDLIITVDTMVSHLSGALGKSTILLNRYGGCWRWGDEDSHSNWYDSVKILRQSRINSWNF